MFATALIDDYTGVYVLHRDDLLGTYMILPFFGKNEPQAGSNGPERRSPAEQTGQSRYHFLANSDSTAVYTCNATGMITYYNTRAADLWGRRPALGDTDERFCGAHMLYRVDGSFMPHNQCPMADVLTGKISGVYDAEVQVERPDGARVIVIVNIAPLIDDDGVVVGAVNSFCEKSFQRALDGHLKLDRHEINGGREQQASS